MTTGDEYGSTYDDNLECRACGAHIADPHDPDCVLDVEDGAP